MRPRAYIAGPISNGGNKDPEFLADNLIDGMAFTSRMWDLGFVPFCPHLSVIWNRFYERGYDEWIEYDKHWLDCCDCLIRMPGESKGADIEVEYAEQMGIDILRSEEEITEYLRQWGVDCKEVEELMGRLKDINERVRTS